MRSWWPAPCPLQRQREREHRRPKLSSFGPVEPEETDVLVTALAVPRDPEVVAAAEPSERTGRFPRGMPAACVAAPWLAERLLWTMQVPCEAVLHAAEVGSTGEEYSRVLRQMGRLN